MELAQVGRGMKLSSFFQSFFRVMMIYVMVWLRCLRSIFLLKYHQSEIHPLDGSALMT